MRRKYLLEYFQLGTNDVPLKTKNGKDFTIVYVDPDASTDSTAGSTGVDFQNRELLKSYGMVWLPKYRYIMYVKGVPNTWGWVIWKGQEDKIYPLIKRFANEIGAKETRPTGASADRTSDEVLSVLGALGDIIKNADQVGGEIVAKAEAFKKKLEDGIGGEETRNALQELVRFRTEMKKHMGHNVSMNNSILIWLQNPRATDVRSKGEWEDMGYTVKENATPITLVMPAVFKMFYGDKKKQITNDFLREIGVNDESELTPSARRRLNRKLRYPDLKAGYKTYVAYDIADVEAGPNAEKFPENNFKWYDADSPETEKERRLIHAAIEFAKSIGVKQIAYKSVEELGGARGYATSNGEIVLADDKKNRGALNTVIHETSHELMHFDALHTSNPNLKRFYRGRSGPGRDRQIIEQEAELSAWTVLTALGYDTHQEAFNYLANWGMDTSNCKSVFDQIMNVADFIYDGVTKKLKELYGSNNNQAITRTNENTNYSRTARRHGRIRRLV